MVDAGSISSSVRIKLAALNSDIAAVQTAFDNLGAELASKADKYSNITGKQYQASLKKIAAEVKNVSEATRAGALTEQESTQRLIALRQKELTILQTRALSEQGSNKATVTAINNTQKSLEQLTEKQRLLTGETQKTASAFSGIAGIVASIGLITFIKDTVKEYSSFQQAMANVASAAGATNLEFEMLTAKAEKMGAETRFSASESADALYYLASAGYTAQQSIDALDGVLMLAGATGSDLAFTSDTLAAAISQFGLQASEAGRVSNIFAAAIAGSQGNMQKLSDSMKYAGPIAGAFGISIEATTAALMALYSKGFGGEQAGTALKSIFIDLADSTSEVNKALKAYGITFDEINPKTNAFADIIDILNKKGVDLTSVFGKNSAAQITALAQTGGEALRRLEASVTGTSKATEMYAQQNDTLAGSYDEMVSAAEEAQIQMGQEFEPALRSLLGALSGLLSGFAKAPSVVKILVVVIAGVVAAMTAAIPILGAFGISMTAALGPIGIAAGAIAVLATGFTMAAKEADEARHPIETYNKTLAAIATNVDAAARKVDDQRTAAEKLAEQAEKNNKTNTLTNEQMEALIRIYPNLINKLDLHKTKLSEINGLIREQNLLNAQKELAPLIAEYKKQEEAVRKTAEALSNYKFAHSQMELEKKKWRGENAAATRSDISEQKIYLDGLKELTTDYEVSRVKLASAFSILSGEAEKMEVVWDKATNSLKLVPIVIEKAGKSGGDAADDLAGSTGTLTEKIARLNKAMADGLIGEQAGLTAIISLRKADIDSMTDKLVNVGKLTAAEEIQYRALQESNAADQTKLDNLKALAKGSAEYTDAVKSLSDQYASGAITADDYYSKIITSGREYLEVLRKSGKEGTEEFKKLEEALRGMADVKLGSTTDDYADKLKALNGIVGNTIEIERERALAAIDAAGGSAEAMEAAKKAANAYFDALEKSDSVEKFKKKIEGISKVVGDVAGYLKDFLGSIDEIVGNIYQKEIDAAEAASEKQIEILEDRLATEQQLRDDALAQEKILQEAYKELGDATLEKKYQDLFSQEEATQKYQALSLTQIDELLAAALAADNDEMTSALTAARARVVADKEANDAIVAAKDEATKKAADLEYRAAMASWTINLAMAIADAARLAIQGYLTVPFIPAGLIAGGTATVLGGASVAAIMSARPSPPALATGGIVLPASGGVPTIQAENGYAEMDLNGGPSGRAFLKQFAQAVAAEMGGGQSVQITLKPQQIILDGKVLAESSAQYFNNGKVALR
jgi:TP901 family phage tail tape measure protein